MTAAADGLVANPVPRDIADQHLVAIGHHDPVDEAGVDVAFAFARGQALAAAIPEAAIGEASIPELEASDPADPADPADASTSCVDGSVPADAASARERVERVEPVVEAAAVVAVAPATPSEQVIPRATFAAAVRRYTDYAAQAGVIAHIWRTCDRNGSDRLEHDELREAMNELEKDYHKIRRQRCKSGALLQRCDDETTSGLMRCCDSSGDGALDRNDFMQAMVLWRKLAKERDRRAQKAESAACALM